MGEGLRCANRIYVPDQVLTEALSDALGQFVPDRESFAREVREQIRKERSPEDIFFQNRNAVEKLLRKKQKYIDLYTNDVLSLEELKAHTQRLTRQMERLDGEREVLLRDEGKEEGVEGVPELGVETLDNGMLQHMLSYVEANPDRTLTFYFRTS